MESTWPTIFTFLSVFTFAIVSPGPNFILVTNTALNDSRRAGVLTALGVATGSGLFALAGLAGLLLLVHSLPYFPTIMRFVGGCYLIWIGFDMFRSCRTQSLCEAAEKPTANPDSSMFYRTGLLTNLTNPKAWAFYLSLFALVITPDFPLWGKVVLNVSMFLISLTWYVVVAVLISSRTFQPVFLSWRPFIQGLLGVLLIVVGLKIMVL